MYMYMTPMVNSTHIVLQATDNNIMYTLSTIGWKFGGGGGERSWSVGGGGRGGSYPYPLDRTLP